MYCVILAAGLGTRMGDLTKSCPKPMLPINGKPKLAYSIEMLPDVITDVVLVVGYLQDIIRDFFQDTFDGRNIHYIEQKVFNGTAGAVALCKDHVKGDQFMVTMGDDLYMRGDLEKLLQYERSLLAMQTQDAAQFGLVSANDNGKLKEVIERPHRFREGLVNTGAYVLTREYFDVPMVKISNCEFGLPQTLVNMYPSYETTVVTAQKWLAIGTPEDWRYAQNRILEFVMKD